MAHRCTSSRYLNDRPRYILGRTIPEAVGLLLAALLGYLAIQLTGRLPFTGAAGKWRLLLIFIPPAASVVVSFVFYADGVEPYARHLVGYTARHLWNVPARAWPLLAAWAPVRRACVALRGQPDEAVS